MGFFKRHTGRADYSLFSNYAHYVPGYGGMMMLFVMFLIGALLGSLLSGACALVSPEFALTYGTVISYPVMFIPALLYASAQSRRNEFFETGYAVDSNNFGRLGGFAMAVIVSVATLAAAFITDVTAKLLPPMPAFLEEAMKQLLDAPLWITLISVSVFAPFFEEWLCRGMIMRGLLRRMSPFAAISISAAFFAVIHLNPWQAIPAFILGLLFGLVYYKTGSLKLTMLMHCANNTLAAIFSRIPAFQDAESFIDVMNPWTYAGICLCCLAFIAATIVVLMGIKTND